MRQAFCLTSRLLSSACQIIFGTSWKLRNHSRRICFKVLSLHVHDAALNTEFGPKKRNRIPSLPRQSLKAASSETCKLATCRLGTNSRNHKSPKEFSCICLTDSEVITNQQANLWSMRGVFYVILSSLLLSFVCVVVEWLVASYREVRLSERKPVVSFFFFSSCRRMFFFCDKITPEFVHAQ